MDINDVILSEVSLITAGLTIDELIGTANVASQGYDPHDLYFYEKVKLLFNKESGYTIMHESALDALLMIIDDRMKGSEGHDR